MSRTEWAASLRDLSRVLGEFRSRVGIVGSATSAGALPERVSALERLSAKLVEEIVDIEAVADEVEKGAGSTTEMLRSVVNQLRLTGAALRRQVHADFPELDEEAEPGEPVEVADCRAAFDASQERINSLVARAEATGSWPYGANYSLNQIRGSVDDIAAYPMLTAPSFGGGGGGGGGGGWPDGGYAASRYGDPQRAVDAAIRATLGRLPKYTDGKAFVAALNASFDRQEVEGHTVVTWRPRTYLGQTELGGGVTGFQASLYARARDAEDRVTSLLAHLTPLRADADREEMDAARGMVASQFRAAVEELGTEGGPRPARVDAIFDVLLESPVTGRSGKGLVEHLAWVFGLSPENVNTIDEEQDYSDFQLVRDYIRGTRDAWVAFRNESFGKDLGTRLVLLSNALQVVAESVDEVESALDSVFVGPAERSVASFRASHSTQPMLVSELLSWISTFAAQEARDLVTQGGRRAAGAVGATAERLTGLVADLSAAVLADPGLPDGMRHPRVRHPLNELRSYLARVATLAQSVRTA